jgi:hypothetical protein
MNPTSKPPGPLRAKARMFSGSERHGCRALPKTIYEIASRTTTPIIIANHAVPFQLLVQKNHREGR